MNIDECIKLINDNFNIETTVKGLKNIDLTLKSRELYYIDIFKEFKEIKIMRVTSKNIEDEIVFDVYFNAEDFGGLFGGYFTVSPQSENANMIFSKVSKICTDLKEYFYYVFKSTKLLKTYLISEIYKDVFLEVKNEIDRIDFTNITKKVYIKLANYTTEQFRSANLKKCGINKYVSNFLKFNSKCSEYTKMFLLNLLIKGYSNHIFFCNGKIDFPYAINVYSDNIQYRFEDKSISEYIFLDKLEEYNLTMFISFNYDFKGR